MYTETQLEFGFDCNYHSPTIKGDSVSGLLPLFSLSDRTPDHSIKHLKISTGSIKIQPSIIGCATIEDRKLLVYFAAQMARGHKDDRDLSNGYVSVNLPDLFRTVYDKTGNQSGTSYRTLKRRLQRLQGTSLEGPVNISGAEYQLYSSFILEHAIPRKSAGKQGRLHVRLAPWFVQLIEAWALATYHPDYFRLTGISQRLYEIARHVCRDSDRTISVEKLHHLCGSSASLIKFRQRLKIALSHDSKTELLDYRLTFCQGSDSVRFQPVDN